MHTSKVLPRTSPQEKSLKVSKSRAEGASGKLERVSMRNVVVYVGLIYVWVVAKVV
jgi:hypothetical protein